MTFFAAVDPMTEYLTTGLTVDLDVISAFHGDQYELEFQGKADGWSMVSTAFVSRTQQYPPSGGQPWQDNAGYGVGFQSPGVPLPTPATPGVWKLGFGGGPNADQPYHSVLPGVVNGSIDTVLADGDFGTYVDLRSNVDSSYAIGQNAHESTGLQICVRGDADTPPASIQDCQVVIEVTYRRLSGRLHATGRSVGLPPTVSGTWPFDGGSGQFPTFPYGQQWVAGGSVPELYSRYYPATSSFPYERSQFAMASVNNQGNFFVAPAATVEEKFWAEFNVNLVNDAQAGMIGGDQFGIFQFDDAVTRVYAIKAFRAYGWPTGRPIVTPTYTTGEQQVHP